LTEKERQLIALGSIEVNMGFLETYVDVAISTLLRINHGLCLSIIAGENLAVKFKILDSVFSYCIRNQALTKQFAVVLKLLRDANERRGQMMHSLIFLTDAAHLHKIKITKGEKGVPLKWDSKDIGVVQLESLANDILASARKLDKFMNDNDAALRAPREWESGYKSPSPTPSPQSPE
jgi:hypothetical protein